MPELGMSRLMLGPPHVSEISSDWKTYFLRVAGSLRFCFRLQVVVKEIHCADMCKQPAFIQHQKKFRRWSQLMRTL